MLEALGNTALSVWVRESTDIYAYTLILSVHAAGLAIVVGLNTAVALRLLGFAKGIPLSAMRSFFPVIFFGFWINAISGVLLFIAEPAKMAEMPAFWGKMTCIAAGMAVLLLLRRRFFSDQAALASNTVTPTARRLAYASLTCWYLALIVGRLTGYPDMVRHYLGL